MIMRSLPFLLIAGFALVLMAGEIDADDIEIYLNSQKLGYAGSG